MEKFVQVFSDQYVNKLQDVDSFFELKRSYTHILKLEAELAEYKRQYEAACVTIDKYDALKDKADEAVERVLNSKALQEAPFYGYSNAIEFAHEYIRASKEFNL